MTKFPQSYARLKAFYQSENISETEFQDELANYWFKLETDHFPKLQSRNYYMGAEIWGLIHDVYGMQKVYDIMTDMSLFKEHFNQAIRKINKPQYML